VSHPPVLTGLRVVEVSAFVAAPLGGATLVELGADVVRVDPPGGGVDVRRWPIHKGHSLYWNGLNQGKRSVNIDMRSERGRALVADLIVEAGAVLTNLPIVDWISYETLSRRRPDLIMVVITGNPDGSTAVDYTVNAALGFPMITGPEGLSGPVNHVLPVWDALTGYLAATAIVAAELDRVKRGTGSLIRISLSDVALSVAAHLGFIAEAQLVDEPRRRYGNDLFGSYGRDFKTADGRQVIIIALTPRQWTNLIDATESRQKIGALERAQGISLDDEGNRWMRRDAITAIIEPWVANRTLAEVRRVFERHRVLWGPYQSFKELLAEDPRATRENPLFAEVLQPDIGSILTASSPVFFADRKRVPPTGAPAMGQHTHEVLRSWLGLGTDGLARLAAEGVIPR